MTKRHDIIWFDELDSTNNEALRRIHKLDNLSVLAAHSQTSGRGQRKNVWLSDPGQNLTFTIVLKYQLPDGAGSKNDFQPFLAMNQGILNDITITSVIEFLSCHGITGNIKLPNDIMVEGKKICGILIENFVKGRHLVHSMIGVGININQEEFGQALPDATSIILCQKQKKGPANIKLDLNSCLEDFMNIFSRRVGAKLY
jgi:BirA family biotin operon repressor/biotin-[acetyl-CoA-carboxylase] ligase